MKKNSIIDFDMLEKAITDLPQNTVFSIYKMCQARLDVKINNKEFKLPGEQHQILRDFFLERLSEDIKTIITTPRKIESNNGQYLPWLLMQDWSHLYEDRVIDKSKRYCVYQHYTPYTENVNSINRYLNFYRDSKMNNIMAKPFYIGKGTITRPYNFHRVTAHKNVLQESLNSCKGDKKAIVNIVSKGLNEAEAYELEAKLIYFFLPNYLGDGKLVNLEFPALPSLSERFELYPNGGIKNSKSNKILLGEEMSDIFLSSTIQDKSMR